MEEFINFIQNIFSEDFLSKLLTAFIIIAVAFIIDRLIQRAVDRILNKSNFDGKRKTITSVVTKIIQVVIYSLAVVMVLDVFEIQTTPMVAIASAFSVAIGLGAQQMIKDLIAGFFILSENQYAIGDVVSIEGVTGVVEDLSLRTTILRNSSTGELYTITNGQINLVNNMSRDYRIAVVDIPVAYQIDIERVIASVEGTLHNFPRSSAMLENPAIAGIISMQERHAVLRVSCKTKRDKHWSVETQLRRQILADFNKNGINLATPPPPAVPTDSQT